MAKLSAIWVLAAMVCVGGAAWAGDGWPVVGTVTTLTAAEGRTECDLRAEEVESEEITLAVGEIAKVSWERSQEPRNPRRPGVVVGDRIRVSLVKAEEGGGWLAVGEIAYLGRGELVKPGLRPTKDLGPASAKVLVKMFAPLATDCHRETANLLEALAGREPERVRVQLFNAADPACRQEMMREGLTCATVLVNNRYEFTLKGEGGERKVELWHRPNTPQSSYDSQDAVTVAEQEIARLYAAEAECEKAEEPAAQE